MKKLSPKDKTIHDQFSAYGRNAKEWMNKCVLLLPQIEKNEIWAKKGFPSIYDYARQLAGMSRNKVNESLRILRKTENFPEIRKIVEKKGVFAIKPVINILTPENEQFWVKRTLEMKKSTLETFVRDYKTEHGIENSSRKIRAENLPTKIDHQEIFQNFQAKIGHENGRPGAGSPTENSSNKPNIFQTSLEYSEYSISQNNNENYNPSDFEKQKIQLSMKLEQEIFDQLKNIKAEEDWNNVMKKILKYYQKGLEAEQKEFETEQKQAVQKEKQFREELMKQKPTPVTSKNHTVTAAIKRYITKRSKGICEHPNCQNPGKHIHHTEPFAFKNVHDPDKLIFLCEEHHQIIHLGYIDDSIVEPALQLNQAASVTPEIYWQQIEKLPNYDLKNLINQKISTFKK